MSQFIRMILIFVAALVGFGDCTPGGAVSGYGDYKDLLDGLKITDGIQQKHDSRKNGYLDENKGYNRDVYDDNQWGTEEYVYDKNNNKDYDIREYDYVQKCDINVKDCKDGRDCYDKASDRSRYDNCKNQYGDEGRYYDVDDRYSGNRYREYDYDDRYDRECYDNYKNSDDFNKCRKYNRRCRRDYRRGGRYPFNKNDWRNDRNCNYDDGNLVGLGRGDREDQFIRPCALDDRQCIRKYLAKNSNCKPAYGPIPDPLYLKQSTFYFSFANITVVRTRLRVTGLANIKISEFYVNKDTKNLVIALDFEKLNQTSPKTYFRYKRTAKESIVLADYVTVEQRSGTFTAVIPKIPNLRLDLAEVHVNNNDPIPRFFIGPKALASKDPDVIASVAKLFSNLPVAAQEYMLFSSQLFTTIYIQENLCDFGLKVTSV